MQRLEERSNGSDVPLTCLIVDDSAFARLHLKRLIDSIENVLASEAANGNEASTEYRRLKPDFVLTDIIMPGLEGLENVKRNDPSDPGGSVVLVGPSRHR